MYPKNTKTNGFTLLEVTIALSLGLILSISTIQLCSMVKQIVQRQEALLRIQETMQTSIFFMGQAIRGAGNMGCIKWQDAQTHCVLDFLKLEDIGLSYDHVIRVTNQKQLKANKLISPNVLAHIKPNTDVLWIVGSEPALDDKKVNDVMMWSDCAHIELFKWRDTYKWSRLEKDCKTLRKLTSVLYYVSDNDELCSVDLNRNAQAHVEGLQDWTIALTPGSVRIKFMFAYLKTNLEWEQEWALR